MVRTDPHKPILSVLRPKLIVCHGTEPKGFCHGSAVHNDVCASQCRPCLRWRHRTHQPFPGPQPITGLCLIVPPPFPWSPLYGSIRPLLPLPWSAPHRLFFTICLTRTMTKTPGIIFSTLEKLREKLRPHFESFIRTPINYFRSTLSWGSSAASIPVRVFTN